MDDNEDCQSLADISNNLMYECVAALKTDTPQEERDKLRAVLQAHLKEVRIAGFQARVEANQKAPRPKGTYMISQDKFSDSPPFRESGKS